MDCWVRSELHVGGVGLVAEGDLGGVGHAQRMKLL